MNYTSINEEQLDLVLNNQSIEPSKEVNEFDFSL